MIKITCCLGLVVAFCCKPLCAENRFCLVLDGNYEEDLFAAQYYAGIGVEYDRLFSEKYALTLALPIRCEGVRYARTDYRQHTVYAAVGIDAAFWQRIFSYKAFSIAWGPELFFLYGLQPVTFLSVGGERSTVYHTDKYLVGSAGAALPLRCEFAVKKWLGLRLTGRLAQFAADAHFDKGYSSGLRMEAGLDPAFSPALSVLVVF